MPWILLIEDEARLAANVRRGLEEEGFTVDVASNAAEGERMALANAYDAYVVDWRLPQGDGKTLIERLLAALDGVDCLWIGHFDLSCSLGIPGQFDHKDFTDAVAAVAKACKKHKKSLGRLVPTVDDAVALHGQGFDFICYSGDVWALQGAIEAGLTEIRARTGKGSGKAKGRAGKAKKK